MNDAGRNPTETPNSGGAEPGNWFRTIWLALGVAPASVAFIAVEESLTRFLGPAQWSGVGILASGVTIILLVQTAPRTRKQAAVAAVIAATPGALTMAGDIVSVLLFQNSALQWIATILCVIMVVKTAIPAFRRFSVPIEK